MPRPQWPSDAVERREIDRLTPYARNARTHSDAQVAQIAASIKEWGWTMPVLVDEQDTIIAGHGRVMAARKLGIADVPVLVARNWTDAQKRAYVLADNKLTLNGGWDNDLLKVELEELGAAGFDLALTGFGTDEIAGLTLVTQGLTDPDETPPVPEIPVTIEGDLWICGRHRIVCGSSTVETDVAKVLAGAKPHLMVTDPPYGVVYDANWRNEALRADGSPGADRATGKVLNDDKADWTEAWALFPGHVAYVWHADRHASEVQRSIEAVGFAVRCQIIWAKNNIAIGRGDYHWQHEPCWYAVKDGKTGHWCGARDQSTLWKIDKPQKSETGHSTQKPIECMKRPIENNSKPGDHVYEPFSGSGTTLIACEMTGRVAHAVELNPAYVDVAVKRWQDFTGQDATLEGGGRTFNEIATSRGKKDSKADGAAPKDRKR